MKNKTTVTCHCTAVVLTCRPTPVTSYPVSRLSQTVSLGPKITLKNSKKWHLMYTNHRKNLT